MLKPLDPSQDPNEPPIGELIQQLIDEGKCYAGAELGLAKAIALAKAKAMVAPAALFALAFVALLAAVTALAVGVVIALIPVVGPLLAGLGGAVLFAALAGGLGWQGARLVRRAL